MAAIENDQNPLSAYQRGDMAAFEQIYARYAAGKFQVTGLRNGKMHRLTVFIPGYDRSSQDCCFLSGRNYNYALLDFAATTCKHYRPKCGTCIMRRRCLFPRAQAVS